MGGLAHRARAGHALCAYNEGRASVAKYNRGTRGAIDVTSHPPWNEQSQSVVRAVLAQPELEEFVGCPVVSVLGPLQ